MSDEWGSFHATLLSLGQVVDRLGYEHVTFRAVGERTLVVRLRDGRSAPLELPSAGRLSVDALQAALRAAR